MLKSELIEMLDDIADLVDSEDLSDGEKIERISDILGPEEEENGED